MAVSPGTRLGPYELTAQLGAGGMGEVYRAKDTRLDRNVAVKLLPSEFATNTQLKLRFEREAKTISQLNHPNICTLYDVGHENGTDFLVMELIEGETLADRIARGPVPLPDLLRISIEIAEALDKAHKHSVVHRDLKPGNVMLTRTGAKLLDFGLARGGAIEVAADGETVQMQKSLTQEGTIVGTFQYMSPEQLEGVGVDHRTDIFALGAVMYEMATGRRAFEGKTKTSLIAAIVAAQPVPLSQVQPLTPPALEHIIERCLAKDPADRWQSAHDIAEELRWISARGSQATVSAPVAMRRKSRETLAWSLAAVLLLTTVALAAYVFSRPGPKRLVSSINPPPNFRFAFEVGPAVISPDGNAIAFSLAATEGRPALWVRRFDRPDPQRLAGTEGASFPFWSPDSKQIAFFADGKLKRIEAAGGPVERIADAPAGRGGTWSKEGVIVFAPSVNDALLRVGFSGDGLKPVTKLEGRRINSHRFPVFLPDGKHFAYYVQGATADDANICIGSIDGGPPKRIARSDGGPIWAGPNQLLLVRDGVVRARTLDVDSLALEGDAVTVAEGVQTSTSLGYVNVSASENGIVTYVAGDAARASRLVWVDRAGKEIAAAPAIGEYYDPRLSPDGKQVVYAMNESGRINLYLYDVTRQVSSRFTFGSVNEWAPHWSPDGQWIVFTSYEQSAGDIHIKRATSAEPERRLIAGDSRNIVSDWPRPEFLLYHVTQPRGAWDVYQYSFKDGRSRPVLNSSYSEFGARLSPNGKWLAYTSTESGVNEIYVRAFGNDAGGKWQVSASGGVTPFWSKDGKEIYFLSPDRKLMAASVVQDEASFAVDVAKPLFRTPLREFTGLTRPQYFATDGKTFLLNSTGAEEVGTMSITVVQNWQAR